VVMREVGADLFETRRKGMSSYPRFPKHRIASGFMILR
jgi:hypothetical protein